MKISMTTAVHTGTLRRRAALGLAGVGVSVAFLAAPSALADPADPAPPPVPPTDGTTQLAAASDSSTPPSGMSHLPSPDNLPPGTTTTPQQGRSLGYLRDLLHAIRSQDVTPSDALLLLAQRPMSANATPPAGLAAGPSGPVGSSAAPVTVPAPDPVDAATPTS